MARIPPEEHRKTTLMVMALTLSASFAGWAWWYTPRVAEIEALEARLSQIEDRNRRAEALAVRAGDEVEERFASHVRHLRRLEALIPEPEEVPGLLNRIAAQARQTQVELRSIRPEVPSPGEFYDRKAYELLVVGDFHDIGRFLASAASSTRIMRPRDLELSPYVGTTPREELESPVAARFRMETYVLPNGVGQRTPDQGFHEAKLIFEREIFTYPSYPRRSPFHPLTEVAERGPRFEDLLLLGIIFSRDLGGSVALLGIRSTQDSGISTRRIREGQRLGAIRVVEIREREVEVQVEDFGVARTRILAPARRAPQGLTMEAGVDLVSGGAI